MIHSERVILIAAMAGLVSAGFTWFGWELLQNVCAARRNRASLPPVSKSSDAANAPEKNRG